MESQKSNILLEKYWAGNSTKEEEAQLRMLYKNGIPKEDKKYQILFDYSAMIAAQENDFDLDFLDETFNIEQLKKEKSLKRKRKYLWSSSIAASLLIVVLSVSSQWKDLSPISAQPETINSAYEETLAALTFLSEKLNKGNASIYELSTFDKAKKQIINEDL